MHHGSISTLGLILLLALVLLVFKLLKDRNKAYSSDEYMDETRMIQEMYRSLSRMEQRIDALETLLADQDTKGRQ